MITNCPKCKSLYDTPRERANDPARLCPLCEEIPSLSDTVVYATKERGGEMTRRELIYQLKKIAHAIAGDPALLGAFGCLSGLLGALLSGAESRMLVHMQPFVKELVNTIDAQDRRN